MTNPPGSAPWLPLLVWLSPGFPVGGFAYSHGLEWAVEAGDIRDAPSCAEWLSALLTDGSGWNDAVLLTVAHRAITADDPAALLAAAELGPALQPSAERRLETVSLGTAFAAAIDAAWPTPALDRLRTLWNGELAYPVVVGTVTAGHQIPRTATVEAWLLAFITGLVSAVIRCGPIGQTDGQRILAALLPLVRATAARIEREVAPGTAGLDALGGACLRAEIAAIRHETQYTRLFRS